MGLLDFLKRIPSLNEISGSLGEWLAKMYAKTFPGVLVLHDILIDGADGYTSQIDLLLIGEKGIYVVEVKMFTDAKIYGDINKPKWNSYYHGKKYEIYSPIKQNQKHVQYIKSFLQEFGEIPCYSIVAMICEDFKIKGECPADTVLCNSLPAMERGIYRIAEGKPCVWDEKRKNELYVYIQSNQHIGKEARREHKENVISYREDLAEMKAHKICPRCKTVLVMRNGKYGPFYGCPNYPKCEYTLKE